MIKKNKLDESCYENNNYTLNFNKADHEQICSMYLVW